jgi:hypothetical protein
MSGLGLDPRYDDASNPDWYCVHGQYTGNSWGADFLCGMCEDGYTQRITCGDCGFWTWGMYGEKVLACVPNPERTEQADEYRKVRNRAKSEGEYANLHAHLRELVAWEQGYTPKRVHRYRHRESQFNDLYTTGDIYKPSGKTFKRI